VRRLFVLLLASFVPIAAQESKGLTPVWDVRKNMSLIAEQVKRLPPLLDRAKPKEWTERGAPLTYVQLLESSRNSVANLIASSERLAKEPEKLTAALDTLFRFESAQVVLGSLREGIHKYQPGELVNQLNQALSDTANSRETLRQHVVDLASLREQELSIMDKEAQRCREDITRATPPTPAARQIQRTRPKPPPTAIKGDNKGNQE
jgi:alpha-D-ribose 1-methylphosphonate 5-triphosphate synthase subunit PhnI